MMHTLLSEKSSLIGKRCGGAWRQRKHHYPTVISRALITSTSIVAECSTSRSVRTFRTRMECTVSHNASFVSSLGGSCQHTTMPVPRLIVRRSNNDDNIMEYLQII